MKKPKKITKPTLEGDTYLIAKAVNNNAEVLENVLNRTKELEQQPFNDAYKQVVKERDIAIEQLNELGYSWGEKIRPGEKVQEPVLDKVRAEIKEWYWQADKQALAKDPCVVDAMVDLFIRTIDKYKAELESEDGRES